MAISRKTQKDVGNYESKFIGPFTARQTVFVGIASVLDIATGLFLYNMEVDITTIACICIMIAAPFIAMGYIHPYGLHFEDFVREYYIYHIAAPEIRKYVTETGLDKIKRTENKTGETSKKREEPPVYKFDKEYPSYS